MSTDMLDPTIHPEPEAAGPETTRVATKRLSKWTLYWRRFSRNRGALIGLVIFALLVLFAIFGPLIARYDHTELDFLNLSTPPSAEHWFGTNNAGNDLFAQVAVGLQRSLMIALTV
ncbi:ABC transporter permease, partial [Salmonella enterica subsp. enterica serovar Haifa]|nr:ABC transporter permease [Salmonella enterica subsp. enterica serovar Haifa]